MKEVKEDTEVVADREVKVNKAIEYTYFTKWFGIGLSIFPYQIAFGLSLRYWFHSIAFRLYLGPIKFWGMFRIKL